jgi:hypothetical protein
MTTLAEMREWVYGITARPDLITNTTNEILKATIKEHAAQNYTKDLVISEPIELTQVDSFRYTVDLSSLSVRKIGTVIEYVESMASSPAYLSYEGFAGQIKFMERALTDKFDNFHVERSNIFYRHNNTLDLVANRAVASVVLIYYTKPNIAVDTYSSWIADDYPYVIAEHAAINIFNMVGLYDEAKMYQGKLFDNRMDIMRNEVGENG